MRIKEITVYGFSELVEDVQKNVVAHFRDINIDYEWWDCLYDDWNTKLEAYGFSAPKIYFSGFYSQGDGACFDAGIGLDQAFSKYQEEHPVKHERAVRAFLYECSARIVTTNHRYYHWNTRYIEYDSSCGGKHLNAILDSLIDWLEEKRKEFCRAIYRELEQEYDYLTSDEAVKESIEANDYEFTAIGKIA